MIKLCGVTLRVTTIRGGRNGTFSIGELMTEIGDFRVVDPVLDQFEDGDYRANVWIERIFIKQYMYYGKAITEIRASLHDVQLEELEDTPDRAHLKAPAEADPADELPPPAPAAPAAQRPSASAASSAEQLREKLQANLARAKTPMAQAPAAAPSGQSEVDTPNEDAAMAALFDTLWPAVQAREPIKLDSTVDRLRLRQQIAALKVRGFAIDPQSQTWLVH